MCQQILHLDLIISKNWWKNLPKDSHFHHFELFLWNSSRLSRIFFQLQFWRFWSIRRDIFSCIFFEIIRSKCWTCVHMIITIFALLRLPLLLTSFLWLCDWIHHPNSLTHFLPSFDDHACQIYANWCLNTTTGSPHITNSSPLQLRTWLYESHPFTFTVTFHLRHQPNPIANRLWGRSSATAVTSTIECHHRFSSRCTASDSSVLVLETLSLSATWAARAWCQFKGSCGARWVRGEQLMRVKQRYLNFWGSEITIVEKEWMAAAERRQPFPWSFEAQGRLTTCWQYTWQSSGGTISIGS